MERQGLLDENFGRRVALLFPVSIQNVVLGNFRPQHSSGRIKFENEDEVSRTWI